MATFAFMPLYFGVLALFVTGVLSIGTNCIKRTVIYERIPPELVSKYTGCSCSLLALGAILGNLLGGALSSVLSTGVAFFATSAPAIIVFLAMVVLRHKQLSGLFSHLDSPAAPTEQA